MKFLWRRQGINRIIYLNWNNKNASAADGAAVAQLCKKYAEDNNIKYTDLKKRLKASVCASTKRQTVTAIRTRYYPTTVTGLVCPLRKHLPYVRT